jgi:hypothetical protein
MKQIYKVISIFMILILISTTAMAAKPTSAPTPTPISNPEQVQNARLTTLETNDTLQKTNNSEQQGLVNGLINQLTSLTNRITSLENSVTNLVNDPYPAIYSTGNSNWQEFYDNNEHQLGSLSFVLPKDAYVIIQTDSDIDFWNVSAISYIIVDNIPKSYSSYGNAWPFATTSSSDWGQTAHFADSVALRLNAGQHTVNVNGSAWKKAPMCECWDGQARIIATAYDIKGSIPATVAIASLPDRLSKIKK